MTDGESGNKPRGDTTLFELGPGLPEGPQAALSDDGFSTRYELESLLGEGGMGEVRLCKDVRIGREVAMKLVHPDRQDSERVRASFLHEARIQGRLEHPSVVPVHEIGTAPDGGLYFTMRRVQGTTLDHVLSLQRSADARALQRWTRRRLLTAFASVCSAIHYAHERDVIHRDLKPSNIMLGEFGEAYVLDWGCAILQERDDNDVPRGSTPTDIAGTPGFMAPELLGGGPTPTERADVYALGAILFEMLTLEPLHPRGDRDETMSSTKRGADARASLRAPQLEIAPELDVICMRATALDPTERYASADDLRRAIEDYLDGDRDIELRIKMADEEAKAASDAARRALSGEDTRAESRHTAMQGVARALALDPENALAKQTMMRLLMEPPKELPPEAQRELDAQQAHHGTVAARSAAYAYLIWLLFVPLVMWMGIRDVPLVVAAVLIMVVASGIAITIVKLRPGRVFRAWVMLITVTIGVIVLSRLLGPYILIPTIAAVNTLGHALVVVKEARTPALVFGCIAVVAPAFLEWVDLLPDSYVFVDGVIQVMPQMVSFPEIPTQIYLVVSHVTVIVTGWLVVRKLRDSLEDAERRVLMHAWHLNMLVGSREPRLSQSPPAPGAP